MLSSDTYFVVWEAGGRKQWESEQLALARPFFPTASLMMTYVFQLGDKMPLALSWLSFPPSTQFPVPSSHPPSTQVGTFPS